MSNIYFMAVRSELGLLEYCHNSYNADITYMIKNQKGVMNAEDMTRCTRLIATRDKFRNAITARVLSLVFAKMEKQVVIAPCIVTLPGRHNKVLMLGDRKYQEQVCHSAAQRSL